MNSTPHPLPALHHACYLLVALAWLVAAGSVWHSIPFKRAVLKALVGSGVIATTLGLILCGWMIATFLNASSDLYEARRTARSQSSSAGTNEVWRPADIRIEFLDDWRLRLNGTTIPAAEFEESLGELLKNLPEDPSADILGSGDASYAAITRVLEQCTRAGVKNVSFTLPEAP